MNLNKLAVKPTELDRLSNAYIDDLIDLGLIRYNGFSCVNMINQTQSELKHIVINEKWFNFVGMNEKRGIEVLLKDESVRRIRRSLKDIEWGKNSVMMIDGNMIGDLGKFEMDKKTEDKKDKIKTKVTIKSSQVYFIYFVEPPRSETVKKIMNSKPTLETTNKSPQASPKKRATFANNSRNASTMLSIKNVSSFDMEKTEFSKDDFELKNFRCKTQSFKKSFTRNKGVFEGTVHVASKAKETKFQFNKMDSQFDWKTVKRHLNFSLCNCIKNIGDKFYLSLDFDLHKYITKSVQFFQENKKEAEEEFSTFAGDLTKYIAKKFQYHTENLTESEEDQVPKSALDNTVEIFNLKESFIQPLKLPEYFMGENHSVNTFAPMLENKRVFSEMIQLLISEWSDHTKFSDTNLKSWWSKLNADNSKEQVISE